MIMRFALIQIVKFPLEACRRLLDYRQACVQIEAGSVFDLPACDLVEWLIVLGGIQDIKFDVQGLSAAYGNCK